MKPMRFFAHMEHGSNPAPDPAFMEQEMRFLVRTIFDHHPQACLEVADPQLAQLVGTIAGPHKKRIVFHHLPGVHVPLIDCTIQFHISREGFWREFSNIHRTFLYGGGLPFIDGVRTNPDHPLARPLQSIYRLIRKKRDDGTTYSEEAPHLFLLAWTGEDRQALCGRYGWRYLPTVIARDHSAEAALRRLPLPTIAPSPV